MVIMVTKILSLSELLSSHDEVLVGEEYEYRLGTFLLNVLSDKDSTIG